MADFILAFAPLLLGLALYVARHAFALLWPGDA